MKLEQHLDKLRAFKVIADSRTMRQAALKLNVTQPALTKLVQNLESVLGVPLLSRSRHGVVPTEAGQKLLAYATMTLKGLEDLELQIKNPSEKLSGHLRIGAYASLAEYLWPEFIPELRKHAPALRVSIFTSDPIEHTRALENGDIDILVDAEPRLTENFISWELYSDRFHFYMRKPHDQMLTPDDLSSVPLIFSPNAFDRDGKKILQHVEENGFYFKERFELDSFMAVLAFAKKAIGLAVLPTRLAQNSVEQGHLHEVNLKGFPAKGFGTHHFAATVLESRKQDPRLKFLIQQLKAWFKI